MNSPRRGWRIGPSFAKTEGEQGVSHYTSSIQHERIKEDHVQSHQVARPSDEIHQGKARGEEESRRRNAIRGADASRGAGSIAGACGCSRGETDPVQTHAYDDQRARGCRVW